MGEKGLNDRLLKMKEELDSVGIKLNGLAWQRIYNHMLYDRQEYAKECVIASLEKAKNNFVYNKSWGQTLRVEITAQENIILL